MNRFALRFGICLALAASAAAETEFSFAAGTDNTGWAQAVSNAAGRVMIESPEFPRGLWVELTDEAGEGLAGLQVEYHGRPDGLVALRCVDPSGMQQETLLVTRPGGAPIRLELKPGEPVDLPEGLVLIDLRIEPAAEALLKSEEVPRLSGWEALGLYLQERWQGRTGRVAVQVDSTALGVDLAHSELQSMLGDYLHDLARKSLGKTRASVVQVLFLNAHVFESDLAFLEGVILLSPSFILVEGSMLEKWVLEDLGRSEGPVTLAEADALTSFHVRGISDVSQVAALTNLEWLGLSSNEIVDVSPLSAMTNLEGLMLDSNDIVDVSPLAALTSLEVLDLAFNEIVDLSPLALLTNLRWLRLYSNEIVDLTPLSALVNLRWLSLPSNRIVDVSPLTALTNLKELELGSNRIMDVSPLSVLPNLERLGLGSNRIVDVSPLAASASLESLGFASNPNADFSSLSHLTNLAGLGLDFNQLVNVSFLAALTNLEWLSLSSNEIVDIGPLSVLTCLTQVTLSSNRIVDVSASASWTRLTLLDLNFNQVADISHLSSLARLERLWLKNNRIVDVGALVANTGLGEEDIVDLTGNSLSYQAVNEQIPALRERGVRVTH